MEVFDMNLPIQKILDLSDEQMEFLVSLLNEAHLKNPMHADFAYNRTTKMIHVHFYESLIPEAFKSEMLVVIGIAIGRMIFEAFPNKH
jgi:hypothetical protein